jgi:hypothetical protein
MGLKYTSGFSLSTFARVHTQDRVAFSSASLDRMLDLLPLLTASVDEILFFPSTTFSQYRSAASVVPTGGVESEIETDNAFADQELTSETRQTRATSVMSADTPAVQLVVSLAQHIVSVASKLRTTLSKSRSRLDSDDDDFTDSGGVSVVVEEHPNPVLDSQSSTPQKTAHRFRKRGSLRGRGGISSSSRSILPPRKSNIAEVLGVPKKECSGILQPIWGCVLPLLECMQLGNESLTEDDCEGEVLSTKCLAYLHIPALLCDLLTGTKLSRLSSDGSVDEKFGSVSSGRSFRLGFAGDETKPGPKTPERAHPFILEKLFKTSETVIEVNELWGIKPHTSHHLRVHT